MGSVTDAARQLSLVNSPPCRPFSTLPPEITIHIIDLGASLLPATTRHLPRDADAAPTVTAREFLQTCALVSTAWREIAQDALMRDPQITGGLRAARFLERVRGCGREALVASVWATGTSLAGVAIKELLDSCPSVQRLCWVSKNALGIPTRRGRILNAPVTRLTFLSSATNITSLTLADLIVSASCVNAVLPSLNALHLVRCQYLADLATTEIFPSSRISRLSFLVLNPGALIETGLEVIPHLIASKRHSLTSLDLHYEYYVEPSEAPRAELFQLEKLQSLRCQTWYICHPTCQTLPPSLHTLSLYPGSVTTSHSQRLYDNPTYLSNPGALYAHLTSRTEIAGLKRLTIPLEISEGLSELFAKRKTRLLKEKGVTDVAELDYTRGGEVEVFVGCDVEQDLVAQGLRA